MLGDVTEPMHGEGDDTRLPRGTAIDRYVVVDVLGEGGMGVVYTAYDPELDRRVAIKVLRSSLVGEGRPRLIREAQAIARIAHPNVVAVHDVGELDGSVFVTMEFVEGRTLGRWLREETRSLPEILEVFLQAGRGLAAAHAVDLVHRDFKPDNALVGDDGRVRVVDFGLARGRGSAESIAPHMGLSSSSLDEALTEAGAVMGTPAYMAPEQLAGRMATAASDQFSFCVSLYEALYGERPFGGNTLATLSEAVYRGEVREPAPGRSVPTWLRKVLLRGLQTRAEDRHPSMDALLDELSRDPGGRRRRVIGASALGLGAVVVAFLAYRSGASQELAPCAGAAQDVQAVWNDERRDAIAAAFRATGAVHADDTWTRAEQRLDEYASGWAEQATRACVATHVDGTQSTARLELRRRCLAERLQSFDAVLEVMAHANTTMVDRAVQSARGLPDLAGCDDIAALEAGVAPPDQEDVRQQVEQIEAELARIDALGSAARYREQVEMLEDLLPRARATGYLPVVAGVEHALSGSQRALDMPEGMTNLRATFRDALAAGDDRRATMAAIDLAHELGYDQRLHEEGREWIAIAEALLHRIGGDPGFEIGLTNTLAIIAIRQGRFDEAQSLFERLVEKQRARDPESPNLAVALMNLGGAHAERRDYDRAREYMEQAAELTERLLGPLHPSMTSLWANLAAICVMQGRYEEAKVELRRALELQRKVLGERHPEVARSLVSLAVVERNLGDPVESERLHRQALEIRREKHGNDHPEVAESLRNLAHAVWDQGRDEEAIDLVREAEEIASRRLEPGHYEHGLNLTMLASLLVYAERYEEALEAAQRAIAVLDASGRGPADGIEARGAKGGAERGLERYDAAIVTLEEALRIAAEAGDEAALREDQLALIRFELALVLQESGRDPARAHQLATQARDGLRNASAGRDRERSTVETWLREHPAP
ncbi:MAG: serine/threonine protein kinase [Myxococcales bacterium]|nr:serine/threonine protein kinase [Myxococcales bacterium]